MDLPTLQVHEQIGGTRKGMTWHHTEVPGKMELVPFGIHNIRSLGARGFPTIIMINEENTGVKIVGGRPFENYVEGLKKVLNMEELQPTQQPSLSSLLEKEKLIFSKELEVMYDVEQSDVKSFIERELSPERYQMKEILGELYFTTQNDKGNEHGILIASGF